MEVKIAFGVYGHKVDVGMWYFKANHGFGHTLAGHSRVNGACHTLGKQLEGDVFLIGQIEQIVYFTLRNDEGVAGCNGVDVEECEMVFILGHFVAGDFPGHDE